MGREPVVKTNKILYSLEKAMVSPLNKCSNYSTGINDWIELNKPYSDMIILHDNGYIALRTEG